MKRLLLPLLLLSTTILKAQQFGGNPPSVKWRQINTPAAKVIFSQGLDSSAAHIAAIVQRINPATKPTIGYKQRQVSIVLQNQTTVSNGYVGLAPFRSEFYLTPEQNSLELGSLSWPVQLAIHEFRHVQQYNNFNVGLSHALKIVFGEGGQALGNDLSIPNWFFEGDAVYNETHVSQQGRGRLPYFFNGYRALWSAGRNYSWMKLRNGSYRDYIPDHYPMGYMLVAYGREQYGTDFWKNVTHDAASYKGLFYPLQRAVKQYSGTTYQQFRTDAFSRFKKEFASDKPYSPPGKQQHFIADQLYPAYVNDSTLVYLQSTYSRIPKFILKTGSREKVIGVQGFTTDDYFTYRNGKIIFAGYRPDLRWGYRNYNELIVVDINTGKQRRLTRKTKYFSPAFSDDGKLIVAVDVATTGKSTLHLLDAASGKLIKALPNIRHLFYTYPKFYGNNKVATAVRTPDGKMSLALIDIETGDADYLLPFSYHPIAYPSVQGNIIYYTKTNGTEDRLYAVSVKSKRVLTVLGLPQQGSIGVYQPALTANRLAWAGFTAFGYQVKQINNSDLQLLPDTETAQPLSELSVTKLDQDSAANILASVGNTQFPVTKYSKAHGFFNFHSLIPNINDPNYSLALVGENVINTFQSRLSFNYNRNEGYKRVGYNGIYGGLFPYISAGADYTFDRRSFYKGNSIYYNETDAHAGLQVPLNLTAGRQTTGLTVGSDIYYSRNTFQEPFRAQFKDRQYAYLYNFIRFSNQIQQAKQNINPRFAQSVTINYKTAITSLRATQFLVSTAFYFPGLAINHSLVISAAHQQNGQTNAIGYSNDFPFSKGYTSENLTRMDKVGISYHFPIVYPDAGVANLAYLLRLRGYLFYDHTRASSNQFSLNGAPFKANFRSAGAAVFFDTKWFNQGNVSFGVRYSRLLDRDYFGSNGKDMVELVLPVSIF
ncbi:TolB family protein [Mucilaginibacter sp.]|uniref:TolB family protein n=1 Tax=Mucilaginibacter sp. TaxID=1882438 RepID=UPI0035BC05EC